jgi:hypothetical protein
MNPNREDIEKIIAWGIIIIVLIWILCSIIKTI